MKVNNKLCSKRTTARKDVVRDYLLLSYAASTLRSSDANKICLKDDENIRLFDELYFSRLINIKYYKTALKYLNSRNINNVSEDDLIRLVNSMRSSKTRLSSIDSLLRKANGFGSAKAAVKTLISMFEIKEN